MFCEIALSLKGISIFNVQTENAGGMYLSSVVNPAVAVFAHETQLVT